jgi:hypothetical protein
MYELTNQLSFWPQIFGTLCNSVLVRTNKISCFNNDLPIWKVIKVKLSLAENKMHCDQSKKLMKLIGIGANNSANWEWRHC